MRRLPFLALIAVIACASPVTRPGSGPRPGPEGSAAVQSGGPDGESPAPTGPGPISIAGGGGPANDLERFRDIEWLRDRHLVIPVAGVGRDRIEDTFVAGRDGGERQHNAVDILAPRSTPVLAADDGVLLRMSSNNLGGITIFAADPDRRFVYYYAHLERYHSDMYVGRKLTKGDTIGYVGTSGNAPKDVPHLHFQIMRWPADGKFWAGEPINPYPILHVAKIR